MLRLSAFTTSLIVSLILGTTASLSEKVAKFGIWEVDHHNVACSVSGRPNLILKDGFRYDSYASIGFQSTTTNPLPEWFTGWLFVAHHQFDFFAQIDNGARFPLTNPPPVNPEFALADPALGTQLIRAVRNGDLLVIDGYDFAKAHMQVYWRLAGLSDALNRARQECGLPLLPATGHVANPNVSLPWPVAELKLAGIMLLGFLVFLAILIWGGEAVLRAIDESKAARERTARSQAAPDALPADVPRAPDPMPSPVPDETPRLELRIEKRTTAQTAAPTPAAEADASPLPEPAAADEPSREPADLPVVRAQTPATDSPPPIPAAVMPPAQGLALKLKRSQKKSLTGKPIYMLDARIDASAETRDLIAKHRLGGRVVYESTARKEHREAAQDHLFDESLSRIGEPGMFAPPGKQAKGIARSFWHLGRAAVSATRAALSLRITVDSLLSGEHVECNSLEELVDAEEQIVEAAANLKALLGEITSFDGREEVIEL